MKRLPSPALLALAAMSAIATPAAAETCEGRPGAGMAKLVTVATALHSHAGEVVFTVYPDDRRRFLAKGAKTARVRTATRQPATTACFWLPPGYYAVAQYHDENADHHFNHTLWMPKEGFGFSNDAPTTIGLPSFQSARFALPAEGRTLSMTMRYR